LVSATGI